MTGYRCLSFRHWFNLALSVFPSLVIGICLSVTGLASSLFPSICQLVCWSVSVFIPVYVCRQSVSVQYALAVSVRLPAYLDYIMTHRLFTGTTRRYLQLKYYCPFNTYVTEEVYCFDIAFTMAEPYWITFYQ